MSLLCACGAAPSCRAAHPCRHFTRDSAVGRPQPPRPTQTIAAAADVHKTQWEQRRPSSAPSRPRRTSSRARPATSWRRATASPSRTRSSTFSARGTGRWPRPRSCASASSTRWRTVGARVRYRRHRRAGPDLHPRRHLRRRGGAEDAQGRAQDGPRGRAPHAPRQGREPLVEGQRQGLEPTIRRLD